MRLMKVVVLIWILGMPLLARAAIDPGVQQRLATLAMPFVPNAGQWDGLRAAFAAQTFAGKLYVTQQGTSASPFRDVSGGAQSAYGGGPAIASRAD